MTNITKLTGQIRDASVLADQGEIERTQHSLQYVETYCRTATIDTIDLLDRVLTKGVAAARSDQETVELTPESSTIFLANMRIVQSRFPELYKVLCAVADKNGEEEGVRVTSTPQGPALWRGETCLDHAEKPVQGGAAWISRALQEQRFKQSSNIVVVGFGCGYHIESLIQSGERNLSCYEPNLAALKAALAARDLTQCLNGLAQLSLNENDMTHVQGAAELLVRPQNAVLDLQFVGTIKATLYARRGLALLHPRIAVLGPLQGGTIPTGYYTQSALTRLGQRSRGLDMSGFNNGFELMDDLVRDPARRKFMHSSYVEMLSATLTESFTEKPIDVLICMAQAPVSAKFLTELRKKGVITVLWFVEDYLRFTYWRDMAKYFDFVFTIQKGDCIEQIRRAGAGEVHYLPTAFDPFVHAPLKLSDTERTQWGSPLSFVGAGYHNRQQMFASLAHHPFKIWGSEWPTCKPFDQMVQQGARRISAEEYVKIFNATEINLNLHSSTERDGVEPNGDFINPRTFELAGCGAFQLVDERTLLPEAFEIGREIITFNSFSDLTEKIQYYLEHPQERVEIAQRARARVMRDHTYDKRIEQMLSVIYASKFEYLRAREQASPWTEMIRRSAINPELKGRCEEARDRGEQPILDGLVSDIVGGNGKLSETEQKLMFLFHVKKHILKAAHEKREQK